MPCDQVVKASLWSTHKDRIKAMMGRRTPNCHVLWFKYNYAAFICLEEIFALDLFVLFKEKLSNYAHMYPEEI